MKYRVIINKKSNKNIEKMPQKIQDLMAELIDDLTNNGPVQKGWKNYSKLRKMNIIATYHITGRLVGETKKILL
jgi:mRNA-degrading endonuclease RelE of RelBE toxin-antitoxin system